jgi:periplasmic glucans biosynthesis protein
MDRRNFIGLAGVFSLAAMMCKGQTFGGQAFAQAPQGGGGGDAPFSEEWLLNQARERAAAPFVKTSFQPPKELSGLDYHQRQSIRFRTDKSLWADQPGAFRVQLLHVAGNYGETPIKLHLVNDGKARELAYDPSLFNFEGLTPPGPDFKDGYSGFRLHTPMNSPLVYDEYVVFQGASYFRAVGKNQNYGQSARGLAINTGPYLTEEFPYFHSFWLVQPKVNDLSVTVYALLDSESVAGFYKFILTPGETTVTEVECTLFPRKATERVGIAPLSSMFFIGLDKRRGFDDFRPQVHDSDGLLMWNGVGEWIWRPLINSKNIQFSTFVDRNPRGFGLVQRTRAFAEFQDLEAHYGERPGVWVEPVGDWGEGAVMLLELSTDQETSDNIAAFWSPKGGFAPGETYHYHYRLHWCLEIPARNNLAWVSAARSGESWSDNGRFVVVDLLGAERLAGAQLGVEFGSDTGKISNMTVIPNPRTNGLRVTCEFHPDGQKPADIRGVLVANGRQASEVWIYRWTPEGVCDAGKK